MVTEQEYKTMQQDTTFTITINGQEMIIHYEPNYATSEYAHFEFTSPFDPPRRIPVSETGYRSQFSPMYEVQAAPSVEEYAYKLALAIMAEKSTPAEDTQGSLF